MGITVISSSSAAALTAAATPSAGAPAALAGGGFAALLSGQIGTALGLGNAKAETSPEDDTGSSITVDPSLAFLLGNPAITPPLQPNLTPPPLGNSLEKDLLGERAGATAGLAGSLQAASDNAGLGVAEGKLALTGAATEKILDFAADRELPAETANIAVDSQGSASAASQLAGARASSAHGGAQTQNEVATPLHAANWASDFSEKVVWLAKSDQQSAQININPPQLGPVQITLQINGDQATAIFASPHGEVRQAIEDSLPQLREMLSGAGINLGQADVGANLARQNAENQFQAATGNRSSSENAILPAVGGTVETTVSQPIQHGRGLVDLFA